jgi:hypothetical protein
VCWINLAQDDVHFIGVFKNPVSQSHFFLFRWLILQAVLQEPK